jgi:hypothetical protein
MRVSLRTMLAGGAAVLAAVSLSPAMAADGRVHVLTVQLPGGGVEQIQYTGDVAPRIVLVPVAAPTMAPDPFAAMQQISLMMRQQEAAMLLQVQALAATPDAAPPGLPPGASGYSFVSTMSGSGVCMHSVRITYSGGNTAPHVVSNTSGNCGSGHGAQAPTEVNTPTPAVRPTPKTIEVKATGGGAARQVAWDR